MADEERATSPSPSPAAADCHERTTPTTRSRAHSRCGPSTSRKSPPVAADLRIGPIPPPAGGGGAGGPGRLSPRLHEGPSSSTTPKRPSPRPSPSSPPITSPPPPPRRASPSSSSLSSHPCLDVVRPPSYGRAATVQAFRETPERPDSTMSSYTAPYLRAQTPLRKPPKAEQVEDEEQIQIRGAVEVKTPVVRNGRVWRVVPPPVGGGRRANDPAAAKAPARCPTALLLSQDDALRASPNPVMWRQK